MVMNVDEARREHQAFGVDNLFILRGLEIPHLRDAVARDAHATFAQRFAGTVCDLRMDDDRGARRLLRVAGAKRCEYDYCGQYTPDSCALPHRLHSPKDV